MTGVGEPWYTSGVHMWNGAAETLNMNPTARKAKARSASGWLPIRPASAFAIAVMLVVSVAP